VNAALYLQQRDVEPFADVVSFDDDLLLEGRITYIARSMALPDLFTT